MLPESKESISSLEDLKSFVYRTLCRDNHLLEGGHPTREIFLRRGSSSNICGILFHLHGPRAVLFSAVWECEGNRVLFYSSTGHRYRETELGDVEIVIE